MVETPGQTWEGSSDCMDTHSGRFPWWVNLPVGTMWVICYQGSDVGTYETRVQHGPALPAQEPLSPGVDQRGTLVLWDQLQGYTGGKTKTRLLREG